MSENQVLGMEEEFFSVMGDSVRKMLSMVGYYTTEMARSLKIENLRALLGHYSEELTQESVENRLLTGSLADNVISNWISLSELVAFPGRLNKGKAGDLVNSLLMRLDSELLPKNNLVISKLYRLKSILGARVLNGELTEHVAEVVGVSMWHECTMGRVVTEGLKIRPNLARDLLINW